jgi:hypothetical protein
MKSYIPETAEGCAECRIKCTDQMKQTCSRKSGFRHGSDCLAERQGEN